MICIYTEVELLKTLATNLQMIKEFKISDNIFYEFSSKVEFEKMIRALNNGLILYNIKDINNVNCIPIKNISGAIKIIEINTKKKLLKDDISKLNLYLNSKGNDFDLNKTITATNTALHLRSTVSSDVKEVFSSKDPEFDIYMNDILEGNFKFVSEIKTEEWKDFDNGMRGLRPNKSTILSASTGVGKTSLAINIARLVSKCKEAIEKDKYVLYINMEMEASELYYRLLCAIANITLVEFESAKNNKAISDKIKKAHLEFKELNLYITSDKPRNVEECQYIIDKYNVDNKLCLVFIDYLGKIKNREIENIKEYKKLVEWVGYLNEMRTTHGNYHLFILSQLSREGEKSDNPSSRESVSGSYDILSDMDTVLTLIPTSDCFIVKNEKNRGGRDGWIVKFDFKKDIQRFTELGWGNVKDIIKKDMIEDF